VIASSELMQQKTFSSFLVSTPLNVPEVVRKFGSVSSVVNDPAALLEIITSLYNLGPAENPASPRPLLLADRDLATPLAGFLPQDRAILHTEIPDSDRIALLLRRMLVSGDHSIFSGTIQKNRVMHALLGDAGSAAAGEYAYWLGKPTPGKARFDGPVPPIFRQRELNLFSRHCSSCHAAGHAFPPQFLLGTEEEVVEKISALRQRILAKLEAGLMPPNPTDRAVLHSSGDYELITAYLRR